jgi:hypothetical protein
MTRAKHRNGTTYISCTLTLEQVREAVKGIDSRIELLHSELLDVTDPGERETYRRAIDAAVGTKQRYEQLEWEGVQVRTRWEKKFARIQGWDKP